MSEKLSSRGADRAKHEKSWGFEDWVVNNDLYCGKRLVFETNGGHTSLHFHAKKHETMLCVRGMFKVVMVDAATASRSEVELMPGDALEIPQNTPHRIVALADGSELIEFSTHHEDSDSYRVER